MLPNWPRILGFGTMGIVLYSAVVAVSVSFFQIEDPGQAVVVAKAISLLALAAFGQSEALNIYLERHSNHDAGRLIFFNRLGIGVAIATTALLVASLVAPEPTVSGLMTGGVTTSSSHPLQAATDNGETSESLLAERPELSVATPVPLHSEVAPSRNDSSIAGSASPATACNQQRGSKRPWLRIWNSLRPFVDLIAFVPIVYFALVNLAVWLLLRDAAEIGRVCFIVADVPILLPMAIVVILASLSVGSTNHEFHLLVGGATVMFILVSIMLNQCVRYLLESSADVTIAPTSGHSIGTADGGNEAPIPPTNPPPIPTPSQTRVGDASAPQ